MLTCSPRPGNKGLEATLTSQVLQGDLCLAHGHDLAFTQAAIAPVHKAHRLPQVHVLAHGNDAPRIGQQPLDQRAQLEQLQATGVLQGVQHPRVNARHAHAALRC